MQLLGCWLALACVVFATALPGMRRLGMYYDEAFLAQQARGFVEPERAGQHPPSVRSVMLFGRPLPIRNATYLGALKSQLLIPMLALAGSSPVVVRAATLATGLVGLLLCMAFAARVFGPSLALITGLLVAADPSFYFFSQFEWGPFTTNLLCRGAALWLLVVAWQNPGRRCERPAAIAGGLFAGLGVFSRADFTLILAACALALIACRRDIVWRILRERRGLAVGAAIAASLAALPMLLAASELLAMGSPFAQRGGFTDKARVLWQVLDGSRFYRVVAAGGVFDRMLEGEAPWTPFALLLLCCWIALAARARRHGNSENPSHSGTRFLLVLCPLLALGMLLLPGAVRAHHQLNLLPFDHMLVSLALLGAWRATGAGGRPRPGARALALLVLAAVLVGDGVLIARTEALIAKTGGRGRWSHALDEFALSIDAQPGTRVVSLDWGFHEPLLFMTDHVALLEPIWVMSRRLQRGQPWQFEGDEQTVYLVHDPHYDLFGLSERFLSSARRFGAGENADRVRIEPHVDRTGENAFYSVRILMPHRLVYGGRFRIVPKG